ncbi:MAG TPA: hypothetical protein VFZ35_00250 [Sphingomicrobium sp.]
MRIGLLAFVLVLAACDRGPAVPSAAENRDLDEAAAMLDEAGNNLAAIDESELEPGNDSGP